MLASRNPVMAGPTRKRGAAFLRPLFPLLLLLALPLTLPSLACSESESLDELEGLWQFTFRPGPAAGEQPEEIEILRLALDGSELLITPVIDGQSRIELNRAGTAKGSPSSFTLDVEWPAQEPLPAGCTASGSRRILHGRLSDNGRLSGSYEHRQVLGGEGCDPTQGEPAAAHGGFGAVSLDP